MDLYPFTQLCQHRLLVCTICQCACVKNEIASHLQTTHKDIPPSGDARLQQRSNNSTSFKTRSIFRPVPLSSSACQYTQEKEKRETRGANEMRFVGWGLTIVVGRTRRFEHDMNRARARRSASLICPYEDSYSYEYMREVPHAVRVVLGLR